MVSKRLLPVFLLLICSAPYLISQNLKVDGYRGIWYNSGPLMEYGYKFSGGMATFTSRHRPIAIYSPSAGKTFFVYGGTTIAEERHLLIMISYYDHRTHMVPKPVIVYDKMGVREPHDNASLSIDPQGYLWVFISGRSRTRPGLIFKSSEPYSIENFLRITEMEMLTPQPWWMEGYGFLLLYSKISVGREIYFSTSQDGKSWTDGQKLVSMGGHFQISEVNDKKLVTVFDYHPAGNIDKRTNLYLLQTEDNGKTWKTIDDRIVTVPLTGKNCPALIKNYEAEGRLVYLCDLDFDKEGNPVILAVLSRDSNPGPSGGPREWVIVRWKDQNWNFNKVCESDHNYDKGSLIITEDEWKILGPSGPGPGKYGTGGEIALWTSSDEGLNWVKSADLTSRSLRNNSFVRNPIDAAKDFYALWTDGDVDTLSASQLYFTNYKCNKVWVLPYEMKKELEKPSRIK